MCTLNKRIDYLIIKNVINKLEITTCNSLCRYDILELMMLVICKSSKFLNDRFKKFKLIDALKKHY